MDRNLCRKGCFSFHPRRHVSPGNVSPRPFHFFHRAFPYFSYGVPRFHLYPFPKRCVALLSKGFLSFRGGGFPNPLRPPPVSPSSPFGHLDCLFYYAPYPLAKTFFFSCLSARQPKVFLNQNWARASRDPFGKLVVSYVLQKMC